MDNVPPLLTFNDNNNDNFENIHHHQLDQDMVAAPSNPHIPPSNPTSRDANVAKRYRAAPAKTFQCRGYGDCHMVFSRSEHLARHIRKHTGERPFTCHCGKQFSRLDNLRQHAQTVHSDKQEENERMMRDLTALHTSMTAAHKAANARGKRAQQQQQHASASSAAAVTTSAAAAAGAMGNPTQLGMGVGMNNGVKVEELQMHRSLSHSANNYGQQRPGTSVGYDVGPDSTGPAPSFGHRAWQLDTTANNPSSVAHHHPHAGSRPYPPPEQLQLQPGQHQQQQRLSTVSAYAAHHTADGHSFRDSHQSFRGSAQSPTTTTSTQYQHGQQYQQQSQQHGSASGQSFLPSSQSFLPSPAELASGRPSSSRSRPPTSSGPDPTALPSGAAAATNFRTTLPPLHSVVPQSITASSRQSNVFQLPPGSAGSGAARRPGTAPATYAYLPLRSSFGSGGRSTAATAASGSAGGGLEPVPELSVYGSSTELGGPGVPASAGSTHEFVTVRGQREYTHTTYDYYSSSPPDGYGSGANDSPFSFHPPSLADSGPSAATAGPSRLRKRPYNGSESDDDGRSDDIDDDGSDSDTGIDVFPPGSSAGAATRPPPTPSTAAGERTSSGIVDFDYGSGSRPQSRRLSVMELCNDDNGNNANDITSGSHFLPLSSNSAGSRPATASGRFEFASAGAAAALAESDAAVVVPIKTIPPSSAATTTAISAGGRTSSPGASGSPGPSSPFAYGIDSTTNAIGIGGTGGGLHSTIRRHGAGTGASSSPGSSSAPPAPAPPTTTSVLPRAYQHHQHQQFQRSSPTLSYGRGSPSSISSPRSNGSGSGSSGSTTTYTHVGSHSGDGLQQQSYDSGSSSSRHDQVRTVSVSPRGRAATPAGVRV